jgi:hypothetical protein
MKDYTSPESKQLSSTIHEYQVYNHLLTLKIKDQGKLSLLRWSTRRERSLTFNSAKSFTLVLSYGLLESWERARHVIRLRKGKSRSYSSKTLKLRRLRLLQCYISKRSKRRSVWRGRKLRWWGRRRRLRRLQEPAKSKLRTLKSYTISPK